MIAPPIASRSDGPAPSTKKPSPSANTSADNMTARRKPQPSRPCPYRRIDTVEHAQASQPEQSPEHYR